MQVQPCRSAWCLRGCVLNCANKCDFACGFCMPLGFSWLPNRGRREWFRDIVACLELSVHWVRHWVPSGLIYFALDFEVESMWFFQLEYMNLSGWLLMFFYWPSKYLIAQRLDDLDVDLAFFRQGHSNWNTESRHLGSQMRFDDDIRILRYLEDTSPGKLIHTVARGSNSGLPLSTGKVLSLKHRKWRSSSSIRWLQLSVLACIEKDEKVGQKLITAS
jgi:hypothetical protein